MRLIAFAEIEVRAEAWQGEGDCEPATKERFSKIAKLMDAIHNIPAHLTSYDTWNQHYFELCRGDKNSEIGSWLHRTYEIGLVEARLKMDVGNERERGNLKDE